MKTYTDIKQSAQLALLLPAESADMWWAYYYDVVSDTGEYDKEPMLHKPIFDTEHTIPCWSLASLLNYLRKLYLFPKINADEFGVTMNISCFDKEAESLLAPIHNIKVKAENFIDACYDFILKLHEQKLL